MKDYEVPPGCTEVKRHKTLVTEQDVYSIFTQDGMTEYFADTPEEAVAKAWEDALPHGWTKEMWDALMEAVGFVQYRVRHDELFPSAPMLKEEEFEKGQRILKTLGR